MKRLLIATVAVLGVWACGAGEGGDAASATDTLTRRQKDSIISEIPLPGAGGISDAQRAADRLNARAEAHDTIG